MRIVFELVKAGSGSDVWTRSLAGALKGMGVDTVINTYPHNFQYFPHGLHGKIKYRPGDIVHANSWNGFAFRDKVPLVVTEHHVVHDPILSPYKSLPQKIFHKFVYAFEKKSFEAADRIVCVSDYTSKKVKEVFGVESIRIHNGVDTEFFRPGKINRNLPGIKRSKLNLLFVGNLARRKGVDLLPRIMNLLGDTFSLICVSGLRTQAKNMGPDIYQTGRLSRQDLLGYYNSCDILLFPSRLEGFGYAVAEAMACAKPVVATNCSSLPELIVDEEGGFLCELDDIESFAARVRILHDPELREKMGIFNRQRVADTFSLKKMAKEYLLLYQELLPHHSP